MRVAVLASGGGSNLQALIDACGTNDAADIVLVASNNPAAGAIRRAEHAAIPTAIIDDWTDGPALIRQLESVRAELVVLAGYLKLVPPQVVAAFAGRMINIHPALLPAFGGPGMYGRRVHEAVLTSGATVSGATVHLVTADYDKGPIIGQWPVPVHLHDTPADLAARVLEVEHQLLPAVVLMAARSGGVIRMPLNAPTFTAGRSTVDLLATLCGT